MSSSYLNGRVAAAGFFNSNARLMLAAFASTMFVSALLLFGVQPMFAKMVLPKLGGSAAVWSIALVFFQAVLLAGYAYAHVLAKFLAVRTAALVHLGVLALAFVFLPLAYPAGWQQPPTEGQALWVFGLFAAGVGLPFFAVSANAPLLQSWFARTGHEHSSDPYFLYGASNIGSFAALLLYPFVIEPLLAVQVQSWLWMLGYGLLIACIAGSALLTIAAMRRPGGDISDNTAPLDALTWQKRGQWVWLAFVPSGLLVSVTAYISTDLVAAPFLWVIPLALFLLTFVIAFQRQPVLSLERVSWWHQAYMFPLLIVMFSLANAFVTVPLHLAAFFIMAMVCHSELVARRPNAVYLTEFYLWMSFGGVLGGLFASLMAANVFDRIIEYPLLIVAACFCRSDVWAAIRQRRLSDFSGFAALPIILLPAVLDIDLSGGAGKFAMAACGAVIAILLIRLRSRTLIQTGLVAAALTVTLLYGYQQQSITRARSFYGVHTVLLQPGGYHALMHGTTVHGVQKWREGGIAPGGRPAPLSYYYDGGPFADAIAAQRTQNGGMKNVVVIGLGAGAMACHKAPGETWRYFEIDAEVARLARNEDYFTFLRDCDPTGNVVIGDGRLTLANEKAGSIDLLVIDAFSSDAIPVHLLTTQAFELYFSRLSADGVLLFHVSNKYMDLPPVLAAVADKHGAAALQVRTGPGVWPVDGSVHKFPARLVAIARKPGHLKQLAGNGRWELLHNDKAVYPWSDDYSNVLTAIWRKMWQ